MKRLISLCLLHLTVVVAYPPGWSDDILILDDSLYGQTTPDVVCDSANNSWITFNNYGFGNGDIFYTKRDSLGNPLILPSNLSNNNFRSWFSRVAIDSTNRTCIIWRDSSAYGYGLWFAKFASDGGPLVSPKLVVDGYGSMFGQLMPAIDCSRQNTYSTVWDELPPGSDNEIHFTKIDTLGNAIISNVRISPPDSYAGSPDVEIDSSFNHHVVYWQFDVTNATIYYSKRDSSGQAIIQQRRISNRANCRDPSVVLDRSNKLHLVYCCAGESTIFYEKLDLSGNVLIPDMDISNDSLTLACEPELAIDSRQNLHIVWWGQPASPAEGKIYYCKMDTAGHMLVSRMPIVYPPYSYAPRQQRIAVDRSDRLHLVWVDCRNSRREADIYYKRGENEVGIEDNDIRLSLSSSVLDACPDPFSKKTEIRFQVPDDGQACLEIYDCSGRLVRRFSVPVSKFSRNTSVTWQGDDEAGRKLPNGIYFMRLAFKSGTMTRTVVLVR